MRKEIIYTLLILCLAMPVLAQTVLRSSSYVLTVEQLAPVAGIQPAGGGALQVIGEPVAYPSPLSISEQNEIIFQYQLSADADVSVYVISVTTELIKKIHCDAGGTGGSAGYNNVPWNLITDRGDKLAVGIYVFSIIDRENGTTLKKAKFIIRP